MQDNNSQKENICLPHEQEARSTFRIHCSDWEARLIGAFAKDTRLQSVLEYGDDFSEHIASLCFRKPVQNLSQEEIELGSVLAKSGSLGYDSGYMAQVFAFSPSQARSLLNEYYAVFYKSRRWIKSYAKGEAQRIIEEKKNSILEANLAKSRKNCPKGWDYLGEMSFSVPWYAYERNVEKWFRHHFEAEIEIEGTLVKLPIEIVRMPS